MTYDSDYEIRLATLEAMGGDVTKHYDSVYEIDLEILKLTEQGGSGKAIEEVSELPEASENKDKLFRLDNAEKDVYVAKLLSSVTITTNRLPDEQQIDKAYLDEEGEDYKYCYYYKGAYKIICSDGELDGYGWLTETDGDGFWRFYLSEDNAVNVTGNSTAIYYANEDYAGELDVINHTITTDMSSEELGDASSQFDGEIPIPATYNAPESAQIGNAYLNSSANIYTGEEYTFTYNSVTYNGYKWGNYYASSKPASEIYFKEPETQQDFVISDTIFYSIEDEEIINLHTLYIPQLNAPDSEQVDVAKIYDTINNAYYVCTESVNIYCYDGVEVPAYLWVTSDAVEWGNIMSNAPSTCYSSVPSGIICNEDLYYDYNNERWVSLDNSSYVINALGTDINYGYDGEFEYRDLAKYKRTETTEEWDWQQLTDNATNDDIDLMFSSEIKLIRYQDAEQQAEGYVDMWVNTSGETMEYDGNTYYKWVSWANNGGAEPAVENPDFVMLTNTLDISLPFNVDSPEYEYTITYDSEEGTWGGDGAYFKGDYTQKIVPYEE